MELKCANWMAFYHRFGREVSLPFYFEGRPSIADAVLRIRRHADSSGFVIPLFPTKVTADARARAFMFVNGMTNFVITPLIGGSDEVD